MREMMRCKKCGGLICDIGDNHQCNVENYTFPPTQKFEGNEGITKEDICATCLRNCKGYRVLDTCEKYKTNLPQSQKEIKELGKVKDSYGHYSVLLVTEMNQIIDKINELVQALNQLNSEKKGDK